MGSQTVADANEELGIIEDMLVIAVTQAQEDANHALVHGAEDTAMDDLDRVKNLKAALELVQACYR